MESDERAGPGRPEPERSPESERPAEPEPPASLEAPPASRKRRRGLGDVGVGVWTTVVVAVAVAAAFLVFVAQNTDQVHVEWTVWKVDVSLAAVVFGAMLLGAVLTLLIGAVWRIRRRRHRRDREELRRLREGV